MAVSWPINGGDPNYLLTGMILQIVDDTCYLEIVFDDVEKVSLKLSKLERCPNMVPAPHKKILQVLFIICSNSSLGFMGLLIYLNTSSCTY